MSLSSFARNFASNGNFLGLLAANTVLGSAMPMLIILGGLAGLILAPTTVLATLPASLQMLAGLFAAAPFSLLMGRFGRKVGFLTGGLLAIIGALIGAWAMTSDNFILLCVAHFSLGAALACFQYFRFAAGEVVTSDWQPVAISLMLTSGLIAAFVGPQVFIIAKDTLAPAPLAGAYAAIAVITLIGLAPLALVRIPKIKPLATSRPQGRFAALEILKQRPILIAIGIAAVSQGIMVFLMIPTPLAMIGSGFSEAMAGDVIRWHVVAMFAPSFFTGFLIKRFGARLISTTGLVLLIIAATAAAMGLSAMHFYGSLILLGLGWNFGFIGATTMLANAVSEQEKPVVQGINDTVIALVSTVFAFAAGAIIAGFGWAILAIVAVVGLVLALGIVMFVKQ